MTSPAYRVVLSSVTTEAASGVDPSVYPVLKNIIPAVGKPTFRRVRVLVARLRLLFIGVAVGTKRDLVAGVAEPDRL